MSDASEGFVRSASRFLGRPGRPHRAARPDALGQRLPLDASRPPTRPGPARLRVRRPHQLVRDLVDHWRHKYGWRGWEANAQEYPRVTHQDQQPASTFSSSLPRAGTPCRWTRPTAGPTPSWSTSAWSGRSATPPTAVAGRRLPRGRPVAARLRLLPAPRAPGWEPTHARPGPSGGAARLPPLRRPRQRPPRHRGPPPGTPRPRPRHRVHVNRCSPSPPATQPSSTA